MPPPKTAAATKTVNPSSDIEVQRQKYHPFNNVLSSRSSITFIKHKKQNKKKRHNIFTSFKKFNSTWKMYAQLPVKPKYLDNFQFIRKKDLDNKKFKDNSQVIHFECN